MLEIQNNNQVKTSTMQLLLYPLSIETLLGYDSEVLFNTLFFHTKKHHI
jgi:hypothetical protein